MNSNSCCHDLKLDARFKHAHIHQPTGHLEQTIDPCEMGITRLQNGFTGSTKTSHKPLLNLQGFPCSHAISWGNHHIRPTFDAWPKKTKRASLDLKMENPFGLFLGKRAWGPVLDVPISSNPVSKLIQLDPFFPDSRRI